MEHEMLATESIAVVEIVLQRGMVTLIDAADAGLVLQTPWTAANYGRTWYAKSWRGGKLVYLHRLLLGFPPSQIDHVNTNGLDNRRANLRLCSASQNNMNQRPQSAVTSRFKGVSRRHQYGDWTAHIKRFGRQYNLGCFASEAEAALTYDHAARALFGRYARTNFFGE